MLFLRITSHEEAGLAVEVDIAPGLPPVWADSGAVTRIFSNLLTNALRHGEDALSVRLYREGNGIVSAFSNRAEDLTADLRCQRTKAGREIEYARTRLVVAARAANVDVYDTPFTDVNDDEGIQTDAAYAKALGFTGKASISPRHVEVINRVFSPTQKEIDYAYEVMDAIRLAKEQGRGAIALRGKMIDAPIVARAEQTIAAAKEMGLGREEQV